MPDDTVNKLTIIAPATSIESFGEDRTKLELFLKKQLKENKDFGVIPGTTKKTLLQPGAEKLANFYGIRPEFSCLKEIEDWERGFVYYKYKCTLVHIKSGLTVGDAERSCNSRETKYKFKTAYDLANTVKAMAQKRALVAAVRTATMAADLFLEDEAEAEGSGPATKAEDPLRVRLMGKLFATAAERGFGPEKLDKIMEAKFGTDSMTKITNAQLQEGIDSLNEKFRVVGKDNAPEPLKDPEEEKFLDDAVEILEPTKEELVDRVKKSKDLAREVVE